VVFVMRSRLLVSRKACLLLADACNINSYVLYLYSVHFDRFHRGPSSREIQDYCADDFF